MMNLVLQAANIGGPSNLLSYDTRPWVRGWESPALSLEIGVALPGSAQNQHGKKT